MTLDTDNTPHPATEIKSNKPAQEAGLRRLLENIESTIKYSALLSSVIIAMFFLYLIYQSIYERGKFTISTFSVSKSLADNGFNGTVVVHRIIDEVNNIHKVAHTKMRLLNVGQRLDTSNITIPAGGISIDTVSSAMQQYLPHSWKHEITGECTTEPDGSVSVIVRLNDDIIYSGEEKSMALFGNLVKQAAIQIVRQIQPYVAASALFDQTKYDDSDQIVEGIIDSSTNSNEDIAYAYNLKALIAEKKNKYGDAEFYYDSAVIYDDGFGIAYDNLALLLSSRGMIWPAIEELRK